MHELQQISVIDHLKLIVTNVDTTADQTLVFQIPHDLLLEKYACVYIIIASIERYLYADTCSS